MDLVEHLRTIITGLGWPFFYGRDDFNNLVESADENDPNNHFFLDPVVRKKEYRDGAPTGRKIYTGRYMVLTKSTIDNVYDGQKGVDINLGKFRKHILPKLETDQDTIEDTLYCAELYFEDSEIIEVINMYDENLDGILVKFKIVEEA